MKKASFLFFLCLLFMQTCSYAQQVMPPLELSSRQTTSLIFPYPVWSVNRGSGDALAQVPKPTANVLQVKGGREDFPATNLTIITSDGQLYCFPVRYVPSPMSTVLTVTPLAGLPAAVRLPDDQPTQVQFDNIARQLAYDIRFYRGIRDREHGVKVVLEGIYIKGNTLFYRLLLYNASSLPFELEAVRFATRDRQRIARTATQEVEQFPLYAWGANEAVVEANASQIFLFALERFPLGSEKEQVIELFERKGSRHLTLRLRDRHLLQACPLRYD